MRSSEVLERTTFDVTDTPRRSVRQSLATLRGWNLGEAELALEGEHSALGSASLRQLLATSVARDLSHIAQTARVMTKQYRDKHPAFTPVEPE